MTKEERRECQRLASKKYNASEKGKGNRAVYRAANHQKRLEQGAVYRVANKEALAEKNTVYRAANMDKETLRVKLYRLAHPEKTAAWARTERMTHPEKSRAAVRKWERNHLDEAKMMASKHRSKRRTLGFVPLNKSFAGCEGHHVDNEQVIHLPKKLHQSVSHNHNTGRGMAQINAIAYNFLFKQEVEIALHPKEVVMKFIYVIAERSPYRAYIKEADSGTVIKAFTPSTIIEAMGDTDVLNTVYDILIRDHEINPGDILAPERHAID